MKKLFIVLAVLLMLVGCSNKKDSEVVDEPVIIDDPQEIVGGYTLNADLPEMNDMIFDSARKGIDGASYSPILILGRQTVAGENIAYLAYSTAVVPNAKPALKVVTVFNDLENKTQEITNVNDFDYSAYLSDEGSVTPEGLMGGWQDNAELPCLVGEDEKATFEKALEGLTGVGYSPVAVLATQVVAGTNIVYLAQGTVVNANPISHIYVVNVFKGLDGSATLNNICALDLSSLTAPEK